jgi:tripartite-type tricarboxylate transporter receptor subunit TctC
MMRGDGLERNAMTQSGSNRRQVLGALLGGGATALGAGGAGAQNYPDRPIRLVVPFAPGGLNDTVARLIQPHLEKSLGHPVIVDNRPGASGIIGADAVAKAAPDGYQLLMVASSYTVIPATHSKVPYDSERDLQPIAMVGKNPLLFVVNSKVPAKDLREFVALAKANPDKFNYSSPGAASQNHLVIELFSKKAGIKLQHVPYRGGAPAVTATIAGEAQFTVISPLASLPQIEAGNLRAIAAGGATRDPQFPNVPTVAEQGFPEFEAIQWVGLLTTAGTPQPIVARLNAEVNKALRSAELAPKFAAQGLSPAGGTAEEFQATIVREIRNWTDIAQASGIKAD